MKNLEAIRTITKREFIRDVSRRWDLADYPGEDKKAIGNALRRLDLNTVSEDIVTSIIGNDSWTSHGCYSCRKSHDRMVVFKANSNFGIVGGPIMICEDCVREATVMLNGMEQEEEK